MKFETITVKTDDRGIATLTLARPEKHNALNARMIAEITEACMQLGSDHSVRAVILSAIGKSFCAGGDLNWMKDQMAADRSGKMAEARKLANMLYALDSLPKPLIGRIEGNAFGGGIGMMAVCDIVIATPRLKFALTETKLGLIPATIGPFVLRRMTETFARQVMLSAKIFSTDFAHRCGLVSTICELDDVQNMIEIELNAILETQPNAVGAAKAFIQKLRPKHIEEEIEISISTLADCWETAEAQTQINKFLTGKT